MEDVSRIFHGRTDTAPTDYVGKNEAGDLHDICSYTLCEVLLAFIIVSAQRKRPGHRVMWLGALWMKCQLSID